MKALKLLFILILLSLTNSWASGDFSENDCVHCGGEAHQSDVEMNDIEKELVCLSHKIGRFDNSIELGVELFGSEKEFYKNYHRIQCPPYYPSPLYHSIENKYYAPRFYRELKHIHEYLSLEERQYLMNRPDKGRRKATLLDIAIITKKMFERGGAPDEVPKLQRVIDKLKSMGAKRRSEMTEEELSVYE